MYSKLDQYGHPWDWLPFSARSVLHPLPVGILLILQSLGKIYNLFFLLSESSQLESSLLSFLTLSK